MRLVLVSFTLAVVIGYLLGGRLSGLSTLKVRWFPLALVGLVMQMAPVPGNRWPVLMLYASFVLLLLFAALNIKVAGFLFIAVGIVLNFTVIAANGGMPVSRTSLISSGQGDTLAALVTSGGAKHHLATGSDKLIVLGDVIAIPPPVAQSVSIGDVFTYFGVAWLIVAGMRRRVPVAGRDVDAEGDPEGDPMMASAAPGGSDDRA